MGDMGSPSTSDKEKNLKVMRWLWGQLHRSNLKMPPDKLILRGEDDLIYLYQTGFVDTDRYSLQQWLAAFRPHCKSKDLYELSLEEWLDKAPYRYAGAVQPAFDPGTLREGSWTLDELKQLIKDKFLKETEIPYEMFYRAIEKTLETGRFKEKSFMMDKRIKTALRKLLDEHASPQRHRALAVEQVRRHEEFEGTAPAGTAAKTATGKVKRSEPASSFKSNPDQQKQDLGKLGQLLTGKK